MWVTRGMSHRRDILSPKSSASVDSLFYQHLPWQILDSPEQLDEKTKEFIRIFREARHVVVHTGAGVSTAAGIPDFRGPKGVWTLEEKGMSPQMNTTFDDASPSLTHMALVKLVEENLIQYIVSQNVDGLHIKSGIPRYEYFLHSLMGIAFLCLVLLLILFYSFILRYRYRIS